MAKKVTKKNDLASEIGKRGAFSSLQQEAFLNLVRTHEQVTGEFNQLFKSHGLSSHQYNVLRILQGESEPMQIYQIAARMIAPQTDISRLIERLVNTGLVLRDRCGEDRRVVWVSLTSQGKVILKKLARPVEKLHRSQFESLSDRDLATLNRLLFRARRPTEG
jgi:DNA-binding MarR family transcriptional regulator